MPYVPALFKIKLGCESVGWAIFPDPAVKLHKKLVALIEFTSGMKFPGAHEFSKPIKGRTIVAGLTCTVCETEELPQLLVTVSVTV